MQAIITKYLVPTNNRNARISARCEAGTIVVPYNHSLGGEENHETAARVLIRKLGWPQHGKWYAGVLPGRNDDMVFVCGGKPMQFRKKGV